MTKFFSPQLYCSAGGATSGSRSRSGVLTSGSVLLPPLVDPVSRSIGDAAVRLPPLPPGACFRDVYNITLLVDNREQVT